MCFACVHQANSADCSASIRAQQARAPSLQETAGAPLNRRSTRLIVLASSALSRLCFPSSGGRFAVRASHVPLQSVSQAAGAHARLARLNPNLPTVVGKKGTRGRRHKARCGALSLSLSLSPCVSRSALLQPARRPFICLGQRDCAGPQGQGSGQSPRPGPGPLPGSGLDQPAEVEPVPIVRCLVLGKEEAQGQEDQQGASKLQARLAREALSCAAWLSPLTAGHRREMPSARGQQAELPPRGRRAYGHSPEGARKWPHDDATPTSHLAAGIRGGVRVKGWLGVGSACQSARAERMDRIESAVRLAVARA
jgi:hypothetical protein